MSRSEERYIPINKGHFDLDTEERKKAFSAKLAAGWEEEYAEYRRLWIDLPRKREVRDYPLLVDLELASVCNLNCPMCYTITDEFKSKVKRGLMKFDLFKRIVDEIAGKVYAIRLSLRGEPTLHKKFIECIEYAKNAGIKEVSTLTHGGRLELELFKKAVDAGIDWFTVSVDGLGETYDKIRKPLTIKDTLRRLREIHQFKEEHGLVKPVIKVQGIWPAIRHNPTEYYDTLVPITDLISYNPLIDYLGNDEGIIYEDNFACPQLYERIVISSDGQVMMCSNDEDGLHIIGNAYEESVHDLWHGENLEKIREIHNQTDGFKTMKACRACYYPRKAIPDEEAMVGNRRIVIENYINRAQDIGA